MSKDRGVFQADNGGCEAGSDVGKVRAEALGDVSQRRRAISAGLLRNRCFQAPGT
jgi:hypothetical protein